MDASSMRAILGQIPYTRELGFAIERAADGEVHMTLPEAEATRNLVGTVHAGALFSFGETVAGVAAGLETLERAFPFARRAEIRYRRPARGAVHGRARVEREELRRVLGEISRDGRSELKVSVQLEAADGQPVADMDVDYSFRAREKS